jgi:hypothetical protein
MNKKGQAAMEFLMTYGWAILVVLAAIAALAYFGVLSPQNLLPERTTFTAPLPNVDTALVTASNGEVQVAFRNNVGVPINIDTTATGTADGDCGATPVISVSYAGTEHTTDTVTIPNGAGFLLSWTCNTASIGDKFKATLGFEYENAETTQTRKHTGTVDGRYQ